MKPVGYKHRDTCLNCIHSFGKEKIKCFKCGDEVEPNGICAMWEMDDK